MTGTWYPIAFKTCVCALCVLCSIPWHYLPWVQSLVPKIPSFTSNFNVSDLLCNNPAIWAWWWRHKQFHSIQSGNEIVFSVHEVQWHCWVQYLALFWAQPITVTECSSILCIQKYRSPTTVALLLGLCILYCNCWCLRRLDDSDTWIESQSENGPQ